MELDTLMKSALFRAMDRQKLETCLGELRACERRFRKGTLILRAGDRTRRMGLVLSGSVTVESSDIWGNCTILSHVGPGQYFAETYALLPEEVMLVDVRANEDCRVLFLDLGVLFSGSPSPWKNKLTRSLLMISAHKNLALSGRSFHTSPKSARGRILTYLNTVALQKGSREFDIPFDRQQMADYLNLERTNMSKELGRMQREGILRCRKNHFCLLRTEE